MGAGERRGDSVVQGNVPQSSGLGGTNLREWELINHRIHDEGAGSVPSSNYLEDFGEDGTERWCSGMGVPPHREGWPEGGGTVAHTVVYKAASDNYWVLKYHKTDLYAVHWYWNVAGDKSADAVLGSIPLPGGRGQCIQCRGGGGVRVTGSEGIG